jgi:hypothetical protein
MIRLQRGHPRKRTTETSVTAISREDKANSAMVQGCPWRGINEQTVYRWKANIAA